MSPSPDPSPHSTPSTPSKSRSRPVNILELISCMKSCMESDDSNFNRELTSLMEGLKELQSREEGIRTDEDEIAASYQEIVQKCDKMQVERLELEDKCKMLERENDTMMGKLVKVKDENSRLQDEVSSVRASEKNMEVMYEKWILDAENLNCRREMITELVAKNESLETEKPKMEEQLKSLREELEGEKQMVKEKEGEITELLKKNKALETEKEMIIEDLEREIKDKAEEVAGVVDKYNTFEKENQALELVKVKMEGQLKGMGEELEGEKQQVKEMEREIADLIKKNASLAMNARTIEENFKRNLKEKEDAVEGLTNKYRSLEIEKHDLEMLKCEIEDQLKSLREELEREKQIVKEKEGEIMELLKRNKSLETEKKNIEDFLERTCALK